MKILNLKFLSLVLLFCLISGFAFSGCTDEDAEEEIVTDEGAEFSSKEDCYIAQSEYTGPIHDNNQHYFKYSDSENTGDIQGCPTPETEAEVDDIWEWYDEPEIARDTWSGLLWTKSLECEIDHYDSIDKCEDLDMGGREDWRLPTKNELKQISPYDHSYGYNCNESHQNCTGEVDYENPGSGHGLKEWANDPTMGDKSEFVSSKAGGSSVDDRFWSRNIREDDPDRAFLVRPSGGVVSFLIRTDALTVHCVRCVSRYQ